MTLNRREFVQLAAAMGASLAWGGRAVASRINWRKSEVAESVATVFAAPLSESHGNLSAAAPQPNAKMVA